MRTLLKGDRVHARWFDTKPIALAGVQMKMGADLREVSGVVRHIRTDNPLNPVNIRVYVDPDTTGEKGLVRPPGCTCADPHVELKPDWLI